MFFDAPLAPEVKADPFSLDSLISWLERMPPAATYCYALYEDCLLAQWLKATFDDFGPSTKVMCYGYFAGGKHIDLTNFEPIVMADTRTFGAALERARDLRRSGK